jgi:hypothetical protein
VDESVQNKTHKVLSLNPKTKKVTLSYTKAAVLSPQSSDAHSRPEDQEPEPVRVSKPPTEVDFVRKLDHTRPWANLKITGDRPKYVSPPRRTS